MKRQLAGMGAALVVLGMLAGCGASTQTPAVMPPITPPQSYVEPEERYDNPGSLYMNSETDGLFADTRARRVGDIVMVKVVENHKAKNKADLTAKKDNQNTFGVDSMFGRSHFLGAPTGGLALSTGSKSDMTADGETNREGTVTATIAARVTRVMPGGLLQIEGARETRVNNETQYLVVTGLIRPMDVAADNSITSNRISDAHIAYYGKGAISDKMRSGWFTRLMDNAWPF